MKLILISMYALGSTTASDIIKKILGKYKEIQTDAISSPAVFNHSKEFERAEFNLLNAVREKNSGSAYRALDTLMELYKKFGFDPDEQTRGKYVMFDFLNELRETIDVLSTREGSTWKR